MDLSKFKPKGEKTKDIEKEIVKLQKEKNPEHFSDDGRLRLKPIYQEFQGEVSYDDIRLVMLFVE